MLRFIALFILSFLSSSALAGYWGPGPSYADNASCVINAQYYTSSPAYCDGAQLYNWVGGDSPCPEGESWDQIAMMCPSDAGPSTDDTSTAAWEPSSDPWGDGTGSSPGTVVDENGNVWEAGPSQCDLANNICVGSWNPTGETVDPNDPSTWPSDAIPSSGSGAPDGLNPDGSVCPECDAFTDYDTNPNDIPVVVTTDTSTSLPDDNNVVTTTETTTAITPDGDEVQTEIVTETNPDNSRTETTTTTTTDAQTGTQTTTVVRTEYDTNGNQTTSVSGSSTGNAEGEEEQSGVSGGGDCSAQPACQGDAVQCAILIQQWKTRCNVGHSADDIGNSCGSTYQCSGDPIQCAHNKYLHDRECEAQSAISGLDQTIDGAMTGLETEYGEPATGENGVLQSLHEPENDLSSVMDGVINTAKPYSASCPAPRTVNMSIADFQVSYQPFCDLATDLSTLVRLLTTIFVGLMFYRGVTS